MNQKKKGFCAWEENRFSIGIWRMAEFFGARTKRAALLVCLCFGAAIAVQPIRVLAAEPTGPPAPAGSTVQNGSTVVPSTKGPISTALGGYTDYVNGVWNVATGKKSVTDTVTDVAISGINGILQAIITFLGWVTNAAAALLAWAVNPKLLYDLLQNGLVYQWWQTVRDTLNIFFIGVLLLSAFSTIFQIDRYHYKKVLLNLIIMALLVNFSFPIARFVIEFANRLMYFFLGLSGVAGTGATITNFGDVFLKNTQIIDMLVKPAKAVEATSVLIASVVFLFLFATALLTVAILMLVRVIALILIVIFSPIGFVGQIVPGMGGYAARWWSHLFRYAFYGPVAILLLTISMAMMTALNMNAGGIQTALQASANGTDPLSSMAENIALSIIPIVLLYVTAGLGNTMSIKFANKAESWAKWGVGLAVAAPFWKSMQEGWVDRRKAVREDAKKREWGRGVGKFGASTLDKPFKGDMFQSNRDAARRLKAEKDAKRNDRVKQNEETQRSYDDLMNDVKTGSTLAKEAAALTLASKKDFRNSEDLDIVLRGIEDQKVLMKVIASAPEHALGNAETFATAFKSVSSEPGAVRDLIGKASSYTFKNMKAGDFGELRTLAEKVGGESLRGTFDTRAKDNKGAHLIIQSGAGDYTTVVKEMNTSQLANQKENFYTDDVAALDAAVNNKQFKKEQIQNMLRTAGDKGNDRATKYWGARMPVSRPKSSGKTP